MKFANSDLNVGEGLEASSAPKVAGPKAIYAAAYEVFELLAGHGLQPHPHAYAVGFAYIAKTDDALVAEVEMMLDEGKEITPYIVWELYREHLEKSPETSQAEALGCELKDNLRDVTETVQKSVSQQECYFESLQTSASEINEVESIEQLQSIASQMLIDNAEMTRTTQNLSTDLRSSQLKIASLNKKLQEMEQLNMTDPLTGVANRRAFDARLKSEVECAGASTEFCLALIDLDHFKKINDALGHQAGDQVLKEVASFLKNRMGDDALVARYGGEEFAIIVPAIGIIEAHNCLNSLVSIMKSMHFIDGLSKTGLSAITASVGISVYRAKRTVHELISIADQHLYAAKEAGRGCVKTETLHCFN